jgi:chromate transporter
LLILRLDNVKKRYWSLFSYFFLLGLFTFGGGLAMIPSIKQHSLAKQWVTVSQWDDMLTIAQLTPGAIAINLAHLIGRSIAGFIGGIVAVLGMLMPSVLVILVFISGFAYILALPSIVSAFKGILIVATIFIIQAWIEMAKPLYVKPILFGVSLIVLLLLMFNIMSPVLMMISLFAIVTVFVLILPYRNMKP